MVKITHTKSGLKLLEKHTTGQMSVNQGKTVGLRGGREECEGSFKQELSENTAASCVVGVTILYIVKL
jgi:hypothetical protein